MNMTSADHLRLDLSPAKLLTRTALIQRWQHGSDAFFWRAERAGRLRPVLNNGLLRYRWHDVLLFEGGLPPIDLAEAYIEDLMLPKQVASVCDCGTEFIFKAAKTGVLPARRIGRAIRFVPDEVALWQQKEWNVRKPRMNEEPCKTPPFKPDE